MYCTIMRPTILSLSFYMILEVKVVMGFYQILSYAQKIL